MNRFTTEAIVLKNINYSDSHKIYTLLTPTYGKIGAIARGVRKISSKRAGNLDSMSLVSLQLVEGKNELKTITEAKSLNSFPNIKKNYEALTCGIYLCEVAENLVPENAVTSEVSELYKWLKSGLLSLEKSQNNLELKKMLLELNLLKIMGIPFETDVCLQCKRAIGVGWDLAYFDAALGGILCPNCATHGLKVTVGSVLLINSLKAGDKGALLAIFDKHTFSSAVNILDEYMLLTVKNYGRRARIISSGLA